MYIYNTYTIVTFLISTFLISREIFWNRRLFPKPYISESISACTSVSYFVVKYLLSIN